MTHDAQPTLIGTGLATTHAHGHNVVALQLRLAATHSALRAIQGTASFALMHCAIATLRRGLTMLVTTSTFDCEARATGDLAGGMDDSHCTFHVAGVP